MAPAPDSPAFPVVPVSVAVGQGSEAPCVEGMLIGSTTYVPIRDYTACVAPDAEVQWVDADRRVVVHLAGPARAAVTAQAAPGPSAKLTHKEYVARIKARRR
jgi:hypothetical protein